MTKALALHEGPAGELRGAAVPLRRRRSGSSTANGMLERDNGVCQNAYDARVLRRRGPGAHRRPASRTRWRSRTSSGQTHRGGQDAARRPAAHAAVVYKPARTGRADRRTSSVRSRAAARCRPTTRSRSCSRSRCTAWSRAWSGCGSPRPSEARAAAAQGAGRRARRTAGSSHQSLPARTASAPGPDDRAHAEVGNGRLRKRRAGEAVAPRPVGGLRDPDPRPGHDLDRPPARPQLERRRDRAAGRRARASRPSAWQSRPGPEQRRRGSATPRRARISSSPCGRLERANEDGARDAFLSADEVQAPVDAVGAVDVGVAAGQEHRGVPLRAPVAEAVRGGIVVVVGLDLDDHARRRRRRRARRRSAPARPRAGSRRRSEGHGCRSAGSPAARAPSQRSPPMQSTPPETTENRSEVSEASDARLEVAQVRRARDLHELDARTAAPAGGRASRGSGSSSRSTALKKSAPPASASRTSAGQRSS